MIPHSIYEEIKNDLPWGDRIRILVGTHSSREIIKDSIFKFTNLSVMPGLWVGSFSTIANEILQLHKSTVPITLNNLNKIDIIQKIANVHTLKQTLPDLTRQLRDRKVASKIVRFIDELDEHYIDDLSLHALIDYYRNKNQGIADFIVWIIELWKSDHLSNWSYASILRYAIDKEEHESLFKNKKIYLFGYLEFNPIEEKLLKVLSSQNEVIWLLPKNITENAKINDLYPFIKIQDPDEIESNPKIKVWNPHSFYDEIHFLKDELISIKNKNLPYSEIAIKLPQNDILKRIVRDKLNEWNIPIQDPTLNSDIYDDHSFMKTINFLKTLAQSLPLHMLYVFLDPKYYHILKDISYENGFRHGISKWKKCIDKIEENEVKEFLIDFIICYESFIQNKTPYDAITKCENQITKILGNSGYESLLEFAEHLINERPYISHYKIKISKLFEYYEEYITEKINRESMRNAKGVHLVQHGLWFPVKVKKMICLSTHEIEPNERKVDAWHLEEVKLKNSWRQLHQELDYVKKVQFEMDLLVWSIVNHHEIIISSCDYNIDSKPVTKGFMYNTYSNENNIDCKGSHPNSGWTVDTCEPKVQIISKPHEIEKIIVDNKISFTKFESYLKCPFIFYSQYIVEANKSNDIECEPDRLTKGNIIHKIFENIIKSEFKKDLRTIVEEVVNKYIQSNITKKTLTGLHDSPNLIKKMIDQLVVQAQKFYDYSKARLSLFPKLKPIFLEKHVETTFEYVKGSYLTLTGIVDRIDSDGENVIVIDYKTSKNVLGGKDLLNGIGAQLFGYLRAASTLTNCNPTAAFYMQIDRNITDNQGIFLKKYNKVTFDVHAKVGGLTDLDYYELEEKILLHWKEKTKNLFRGDFSPNPARPHKDCEKCRYKEMCGFKYE